MMTASHAFQSPLPQAHKQHKLPKLPRYRNLVRLRNPPSSPTDSPRLRTTPREDGTINGNAAKDAATDKSKLTPKVLAQYNSIVQDESSLIIRNLPAIKLSINSRSKFMEPQFVDKNNILRPTYHMPTYRAGHHVFTEGISDISKGPIPTFAMKAMRVPYSNLPDSVTIRKKHDKFTFGVKTDENATPSKHKLSNRPYGLEDANIIHPIEVGESLPTQRNGRKDKGKTIRSCSKLEPILRAGSNLNKLEKRSNTFLMNSTDYTDFRDTAQLEHNIYVSNKTPTIASQVKRRNWSHLERGESRIGVISIGESVTPTHYDRNKRSTRQMYPMYAYKTVKREAYNRLKFGLDKSLSGQSTQNNTPAYSRVSTNLFDFHKENTNQSIISNKNTTPKIKSSRRARALHLHSVGLDSEHNVINSRRMYPRRSQPPRSSDSNSSTVLSQFPHNPPPSETSALVADDMGQVNEMRTEMLTLQEERTMTASVITYIAECESRNKDVQSRNKDDHESGSKSCLDTPRINIGNQLNSSVNQSTDIIHEQIKEEVGVDTGANADESFDKELNKVEAEAPDRLNSVQNKPVNSVIIEDQDETVDINDTSYFQERADMICKREIEMVNKYNSQLNKRAVKQNVPNLQESKTPRTLAVPKVSLEITSHHPLRTNASLVNTKVLKKMDHSPTTGSTTSKSERSNDGTDNPIIEMKVTVPVTTLKLNSESATRSVVTPVFSITDELGDINEGDQLCTDNVDSHAPRLEEDSGNKKLLNSTQISFTSPSVVEPKAKRQ